MTIRRKKKPVTLKRIRLAIEVVDHYEKYYSRERLGYYADGLSAAGLHVTALVRRWLKERRSR
jgi:hypothetical protein